MVLSEISESLRKKLKLFFLTDNLIFKGKNIPLLQENFFEIEPDNKERSIAFVDGGQAEIISGGNLSLNFIRIYAHIMKGAEKVSHSKYEFYLLVTAIYKSGDIWYEGKIFPLQGEPLIKEEDLLICSHDSSIRQGSDYAPISLVANMARRFAELRLAQMVEADYVLLDGTLSASYPHEEKYLDQLGNNVGALAKTCTLFTTGGNNPAVLLKKTSPIAGCWSYMIDSHCYFVKLHHQAKHVFRFEGNKEMLVALVRNSSDALFLGYPYGLIVADKLARVSNTEKNSMMSSILLRNENREFLDYLNSVNAHDILDRMG